MQEHHQRHQETQIKQLRRGCGTEQTGDWGFNLFPRQVKDRAQGKTKGFDYDIKLSHRKPADSLTDRKESTSDQTEEREHTTQFFSGVEQHP